MTREDIIEYVLYGVLGFCMLMLGLAILTTQ